jgi:type III restriction enzyme
MARGDGPSGSSGKGKGSQRISANPYNLLYKLGPIEAYDLRLVKRIEVASIRADEDLSDAYVKLLKTDNKNGIKAQLEIYKV